MAVLVGATASGKSELAVALGSRLPLQVVGADSRQVYRRLDIGTAKPTPSQRALVPHHLIDHVEPVEDYNAFRYQTEVRQLLPRLADRGVAPLLVGGTGLYLRAAIEGLSAAAPADPTLRAALHAELDRQGPEPLHQRLAALDPATATRVHPRDRVRIIRFLEICLATGQPASEHLQRNPAQPLPSRVLYLGLRWPRDLLAGRIERRTNDLLDRGWVDEVQSLLSTGVPAQARSMQSLGYREIVRHLDSGSPRDRLAADISLATRQYAKRQSTWFRPLPVHWLDVAVADRPLLDRALDLLRPEIQNAT